MIYMIINVNDFKLKLDRSMMYDVNFLMFLNRLKHLNLEGRDVRLIKYGMFFYVLVRRDDYFEVLVSDIDSNPFLEWTTDLSKSLRISRMQEDFLRSVDCNMGYCMFRDRVYYRKRVFEEDRIYMHNHEINDRGDYAWYVGEFDDDADCGNEDIEVCYVYELMDKYPNLVQVMLLPKEYVVVFDRMNPISLQKSDGTIINIV